MVVRRLIAKLSSTNESPKLPPCRIAGLTYNDEPALRNVVFVGGLHRSGTTLLEHYLHSEYELSVLRADVPESEGQHLQTVYQPAQTYGGPGRFAFNRQMFDDMDTLTDHAACRTTIIADWSKFVIGSEAALLEKSPTNLTKIPWLRKVFPGSVFVIVVRDPRAVSAATQKWSNTSLEELMMHWNVAYSVALRDSGDDCYFIRYEDFCVSPDRAIAATGLSQHLVQRRHPIQLEARFQELHNNNGEYLHLHACKYYGSGVWKHFGYNV